MNDDREEKRHTGVVLVPTEEGLVLTRLEPHYRHECVEAATKAFQRAQTRPEVVYDSGATVGYSRTYAAHYDAAFGKN